MQSQVQVQYSTDSLFTEICFWCWVRWEYRYHSVCRPNVRLQAMTGETWWAWLFPKWPYYVIFLFEYRKNVKDVFLSSFESSGMVMERHCVSVWFLLHVLEAPTLWHIDCGTESGQQNDVFNFIKNIVRSLTSFNLVSIAFLIIFN